MNPVITTILPTFQRPQQLKRAIQSVLNQTYPYVQVCVYDNASNDLTSKVIKELAQSDSRIKYYCHETNIGPLENFQFGLSQIQTPFFSFLSDDDYLLPEFYETALNILEKYPAASFFYGAVVDVLKEGKDKVLAKWPNKEYYAAPEGLLEIIDKYSNWEGVLFKKEVIEKIGTLDTQVKAIDVDYLFRAATCCSFVICKKPCAVFIQHPASYSTLHPLELLWPSWSFLLKKIETNPKLSPHIKEILLKRGFNDLKKRLFRNAIKCLAKRKFEDAGAFINVFSQIGGKMLFFVLFLKICRIFPFFSFPFLLLINFRSLIVYRLRRKTHVS